MESSYNHFEFTQSNVFRVPNLDRVSLVAHSSTTTNTMFTVLYKCIMVYRSSYGSDKFLSVGVCVCVHSSIHSFIGRDSSFSYSLKTKNMKKYKKVVSKSCYLGNDIIKFFVCR